MHWSDLNDHDEELDDDVPDLPQSSSASAAKAAEKVIRRRSSKGRDSHNSPRCLDLLTEHRA